MNKTILITGASSGIGKATDRLCSLVGDDARGFVRAWDTLSNEAYVSFMRSQFRQGVEGRL